MLKLQFPHPLPLLVGCILVAAALSYILPAGQYERRDDPETGRKVVVAGTYSAVASSPVGPFEAFVAIPRGMADAGSVIFLVFLMVGASPWSIGRARWHGRWIGWCEGSGIARTPSFRP